MEKIIKSSFPFTFSLNHEVKKSKKEHSRKYEHKGNKLSKNI